MSNKVLMVGGKGYNNRAAGITLNEDGFLSVNDNKLEEATVGRIVSPSDTNVRNVFGLKVYQARGRQSDTGDKGAVSVGGGMIVSLVEKAGVSSLSSYDFNLNVINESPETTFRYAIPSSDGNIFIITSNLSIKKYTKTGHLLLSKTLASRGTLSKVTSQYNPAVDVGDGIVIVSSTHIVKLDHDLNEVWATSASLIFPTESLDAVTTIYKVVKVGEFVTITGRLNSPKYFIAVVCVNEGSVTYAESAGSVAGYRITAMTREVGSGSSLLALDADAKKIYRLEVSASGVLTSTVATEVLRVGEIGTTFGLVAIDDGYVIGGADGYLAALNTDFTIRYVIKMEGLLEVRASTPASQYFSFASDGMGHIIVQTGNYIVKLSSDLVLKGYEVSDDY